jgi:hypothetical protein
MSICECQGRNKYRFAPTACSIPKKVDAKARNQFVIDLLPNATTITYTPYDEPANTRKCRTDQPAFPLPAQLVTRSATNETLGIGPISKPDTAEVGLREAMPFERLIGPRQIFSRLYIE